MFWFVANYMEKKGVGLDTEVFVRREELMAETWLPETQMAERVKQLLVAFPALSDSK